MTEKTQLSVENVSRIVMECLPKTRPATMLGIRKVQGLATVYGFNRDALTERREQIIEMVSQVPSSFTVAGSGPDSFLKLCVRADGQQWTGDHAMMEQLCCLAIAIDYGAWIGDRQMWEKFAGGMPYVIFGEMGILAEPEPDEDPAFGEAAEMPADGVQPEHAL